MKKTSVALAAMFCAAMSFPVLAHAGQYDFTYTGPAGSDVSGSGVITTGASDPSGSFFTPSLAITGITGTFDNETITALSAPGTFYQTSGIFGSPGNDNILYYPSSQTYMGQKTYLDIDGVSFSTSTDEVNLYFGLGGYGDIYEPNGTSTLTSNVGGTFTITPAVSAAPEPATWAMLLLGVGGIGLVLRRAKTAAARLGFNGALPA